MLRLNSIFLVAAIFLASVSAAPTSDDFSRLEKNSAIAPIKPVYYNKGASKFSLSDLTASETNTDDIVTKSISNWLTKTTDINDNLRKSVNELFDNLTSNVEKVTSNSKDALTFINDTGRGMAHERTAVLAGDSSQPTELDNQSTATHATNHRVSRASNNQIIQRIEKAIKLLSTSPKHKNKRVSKQVNKKKIERALALLSGISDKLRNHTTPEQILAALSSTTKPGLSDSKMATGAHSTDAETSTNAQVSAASLPPVDQPNGKPPSNEGNPPVFQDSQDYSKAATSELPTNTPPTPEAMESTAQATDTMRVTSSQLRMPVNDNESSTETPDIALSTNPMIQYQQTTPETSTMPVTRPSTEPAMSSINTPLAFNTVPMTTDTFNNEMMPQSVTTLPMTTASVANLANDFTTTTPSLMDNTVTMMAPSNSMPGLAPDSMMVATQPSTAKVSFDTMMSAPGSTMNVAPTHPFSSATTPHFPVTMSQPLTESMPSAQMPTMPFTNPSQSNANQASFGHHPFGLSPFGVSPLGDPFGHHFSHYPFGHHHFGSPFGNPFGNPFGVSPFGNSFLHHPEPFFPHFGFDPFFKHGLEFSGTGPELRFSDDFYHRRHHHHHHHDYDHDHDRDFYDDDDDEDDSWDVYDD